MDSVQPACVTALAVTAHLGQRVAVEAGKAHLDDRVDSVQTPCVTTLAGTALAEKAHLRERVAPSALSGWPRPPRHLHPHNRRSFQSQTAVPNSELRHIRTPFRFF